MCEDKMETQRSRQIQIIPNPWSSWMNLGHYWFVFTGFFTWKQINKFKILTTMIHYSICTSPLPKDALKIPSLDRMAVKSREELWIITALIRSRSSGLELAEIMRSLFCASSSCLALDQLRLYSSSLSYAHRNTARNLLINPWDSTSCNFDERKEDTWLNWVQLSWDGVFPASQHSAFLMISTAPNYANNMPL